MGSWCETCVVSNLPIVWNTEARLVVLTQHHGWQGEQKAGGFCYATGAWSPRTLPIKGKYSDYGTVEKVSKDLNTELLVASLDKASIIPSNVDSTKKLPKKLSSIFELIERGRIRDKDDYDHRPVMIGQSLIREDIYQAILNYPLNGHPWRSWYNLDLAFQKVEAEKYLEECFVKGRKYRVKDPSFGLGEALRWKDELKENNDFLKSSDSGSHPPECIGRYQGWLEDLTLREDVEHRAEEFKQLLYGMVELLHINRFMEDARKHWAPQSGKGSQDCDMKPYIYLAQEILAAAKRDEEEYE